MNYAETLFQRFNQQYFNGRLPEYRIILSELGFGCHGECRKKERELYIDASKHGEELTKVLLHEMAHAAVPRKGHGKAWLAEMERLANMGAPTRGDWEAYQDPKQTMTNKDIEAEAFDMGMESPIPWAKARFHIGVKCGYTDAHGRSRKPKSCEDHGETAKAIV